MASEISKRARLRDSIDELFDLEEFRDLCLDLDVDYDNLPGETKKGKAGTLVERMLRKGRPEQLVQRILELRENLSPEDVPVPSPERGEEPAGQVVVISGEGRRWACLIGTNEYDDPDLPPLVYPEENVDALARVLEDKRLGDFDQVVVLKENTNTEVIREIKRIAGQLKVDDLLLIYFSGYALLDEEETERLYLGAKETDPMDLPGSAIDLARIKTFLDKSEAVQKLVLLDCQYGGQKPPYQVDDPEPFAEQLRFKAKGKYLISNALEAAASKTPPSPPQGGNDEDAHSLLTKCLLEGLTSGAADLDESGKVTVEELFTYIQRQMTDKGLPEPLKSDEGVAGTWIVSRTPGAADDTVAVMPASLRRNYKYISEMLRDGSVIPFLGSGVVLETLPDDSEKVGGCFAEPPLERDLAQRIAERAELPETERRRRLTMISEHYQTNIIGARSLFYKQLKKLFPGELRPGHIHRFLAQQDKPMLVVTACYDTLLEQMFREKGQKFVVVTHILYADDEGRVGKVVVQYSDRPDAAEICLSDELSIDLDEWWVFYKIQGTFDLFLKGPGGKEEVDSIVISESDYVSFLSRLSDQHRATPTIFTRPFQQRMFLFMGYYMSDWNFRTVAHILREDEKIRKIKGYAVRKGATGFEQHYWNSENVQVIDLEVSEFVKGLAEEMKIQL